MFCSACGSPIPEEQSVCSNCGRSVFREQGGAVVRARVGEHLHLLAILWFVLGALYLIPAVIMAVLAAGITFPLLHGGADRIELILAPGFFLALSLFFFAMAVLRIVAGWGLLKVRPWGRTFALVMAFLALLNPPFETALGVYTLFVLLPDSASEEYRKIVSLP